MKHEFNDVYNDLVAYFVGGYFFIKPHFTFLLTLGGWLSFVLFPDKAYSTYAIIVGVMVFADLITKQYSIIVANSGFINAFRNGKLSSHRMWVGTRKKIISYLLVMILIGLAGRFHDIQSVIGLVGSVIYALMFLREAYSVCENFQDAGYDMGWILFFLKRKQDEIYNSSDTRLKNEKERSKK